MNKIYDLIIIGTGPAGFFCAIDLVRKRYTNILMIDKGSLRTGKSDENVTEGWAGAGAHSDGKVNMTHKVGGILADVIGLKRFHELLEKQDQMWLDFSPTDEQKKLRQQKSPDADLDVRLFVPTDESKILRAKALANHMELETYPIRHLGTDNMLDSTNNILEYLKSNGVEIVLETEVKQIYKYKNEEEFVIRVQKKDSWCDPEFGDYELEHYYGKNVLIATGRSGGHFFRETMQCLDIPMLNNGVDIGVRVEVPNEITDGLLKAGIYEPKMLYRTPTFDDPVRTFCFDKETEVYTKRGFIKFSDITHNDLFYSVNPQTQKIEFVRAIAQQKYKFTGNLKHFLGPRIDLLVTPEHRMYVCNRTVSRTEVKGKKIHKKQYVFKQIPQLVPGDSFTLNGIWEGSEDNIKIDGKFYNPYDFAKFMGYFLSEGSAFKDKKGSDVLVIPQFNELKRTEMAKNLSNAGLLSDCYNGSQTTLRINDPTLKKYCQRFGKSFEKYVPQEIKDASSMVIQAFLDAYCLGDGTRRTIKNRYGNGSHEEVTFYTSSKKMADDLMELILKIGKRPYLYLNKTKNKETIHKNGTYAANHDMWHISIRKHSNTMIKNQIVNDVPYDDYVYDVTLEKNHTLLVRRNNKIVLSSNCWCDSGFVAIEEYRDTGIKTVNGHSYADKKSNNTNFALLVTKTFTSPFDNPQAYAESVSKMANLLSGNSVLVQRYGDFKAGRRTTEKRLNEGALVPTLDAVPGDLSLVIPYRQMLAIGEMLEAMDKVLPGIASKYTLLYGIEAKFYSNRVNIDSNSMTEIKGLYVAGDGSGWTRGLNQAAIQGLVVSEGILNGK